MKKTAILSLLLAMAMLLGLLAGCGGSAAAPADSASAPEASSEESARALYSMHSLLPPSVPPVSRRMSGLRREISSRSSSVSW